MKNNKINLLKIKKRKYATKKNATALDRGWYIRLLGHGIGILLAVTLLSYGWSVLYDPQVFPISSVQIDSQLHKVTPEQVQNAVKPLVSTSFFAVDVKELQQSLLSLPWIERVSIKRSWPDRLVISINEQQVAAQWGRDALLNFSGELFKPEKSSFPKGLPLLEGADGQESYVLTEYNKMNKLLESLKLTIKHLIITPRGAWHLSLDDGTEVILGRNNREERLQRFKGVYPELLASGRQPRSVDLRYTNGVAVDWLSS